MTAAAELERRIVREIDAAFRSDGRVVTELVALVLTHRREAQDLEASRRLGGILLDDVPAIGS